MLNRLKAAAKGYVNTDVKAEEKSSVSEKTKALASKVASAVNSMRSEEKGALVSSSTAREAHTKYGTFSFITFE